MEDINHHDSQNILKQNRLHWKNKRNHFPMMLFEQMCAVFEVHKILVDNNEGMKV